MFFSDKRVLIVGFGSIGRRHHRNLIQRGCRDFVLCDPRPIELPDGNAQVTHQVCQSLDEVWQTQPDVAFICSPSSQHVAQATACAARQIALFVEKPFGISLEGIEALASLVTEHDLCFLLAGNWKYYVQFERIRQHVEAGTIGRVYHVRANFGQYLPTWRPGTDYRENFSAQQKLGGGVVLDGHELYYLPALIGQSIESIQAVGGRFSDLEIDTEDHVTMLMKFSDGATGTVHCDYLAAQRSHTVEVFGELGTLKWSGEDRALKVYLRDTPDTFQIEPEPFYYDLNKMYEAQLLAFEELLRQNNNDGLEQARTYLNWQLEVKAQLES